MASGKFNLPGSRKVYLLRDGVETGDQMIAAAKSGSGSSFTPTAPPVTRNTGNITTGWTSRTSSGSATGIVYFPTAITLTNNQKLFIKGTFNFYASSAFNGMNLSLCGWTSIGKYSSDNRIFRISPIGCDDNNFSGNSSLVAEVGFDLSSYNITSSFIVGFQMARSQTGYTNIVITDIWTE